MGQDPTSGFRHEYVELELVTAGCQFAYARYTSHYYARRLHIYIQPSYSLPTRSTIVETENVVETALRIKENAAYVSSPIVGEARVYVHVVAPTIWDEMEHLRELQWVRAVVDLDRWRVMSVDYKE